MKFPFTALIRTVTGIAVVASAVFAVSAIAGKPLLTLRMLGIVGEEKVAASDFILREIRDLYSLTTVEYVHKTVFPHDFLRPSLDFESILRTLRSGKGKVSDILSPEEKDYLDVRNLAGDLGFKAERDSVEFVVVTAVVRGGFDLAGTALDPGTFLSSEERARRFPVSEVRDGATGRVIGKRIRVELPKPTVTDVVIEDPKPETYAYPDVKLRPEQWKRLAAFVEKKAREEAEAVGIFRAAQEGCQDFLRGLLAQAGFTEIDFMTGDR